MEKTLPCGTVLTARIEHDDCGDTPWESEDGHGPVSDWERRSKLPGEVIIAQDRDSYRFYDMQEAVKIARRDGWGARPNSFDIQQGEHGLSRVVAEWQINGRSYPIVTPWALDRNDAIRDAYAFVREDAGAGAVAAEAARQDCDRMRQFLDGQWFYVGVVVSAERDGWERDHVASVWGIESDSTDYLEEVAAELIDEVECDLVCA